MIEIITALLSFIVGLVAGLILTVYGFKLGFKASYQIRETIGGEEMPDTLLKNRVTPAEFDLLDEEP